MNISPATCPLEKIIHSFEAHAKEDAEVQRKIIKIRTCLETSMKKETLEYTNIVSMAKILDSEFEEVKKVFLDLFDDSKKIVLSYSDKEKNNNFMLNYQRYHTLYHKLLTPLCNQLLLEEEKKAEILSKKIENDRKHPLPSKDVLQHNFKGLFDIDKGYAQAEIKRMKHEEQFKTLQTLTKNLLNTKEKAHDIVLRLKENNKINPFIKKLDSLISQIDEFLKSSLPKDRFSSIRESQFYVLTFKTDREDFKKTISEIKNKRLIQERNLRDADLQKELLFETWDDVRKALSEGEFSMESEEDRKRQLEQIEKTIQDLNIRLDQVQSHFEENIDNMFIEPIFSYLNKFYLKTGFFLNKNKENITEEDRQSMKEIISEQKFIQEIFNGSSDLGLKNLEEMVQAQSKTIKSLDMKKMTLKSNSLLARWENLKKQHEKISDELIQLCNSCDFLNYQIIFNK